MADRNVVIRLRGDISDFQGKMLAAGKSVGLVADKMTGAEKESQKFRQGLTSLGSAGGKVGLVAAAGMGVAIKAFADFDQAMSNVQAATHETTENMEQLRALALKTGADTAFSAVEAADGIEQLAKAGVSTSDIMGGALQGALDLAAAGTVDVGFAAETAATAMTQFNIAGEQVPHIADLLAAAAGKAQGEVSDMSMALKQSGLVAAQTGLTLEETTGTLAAFASAGLIGSDAGTSFKTMLQSLTPSSKEAADTMESLGISAYDAQGNFIGITEFAGVLRKALKDLTVEQQNATLKTIFGSDAVRAASVIYQQGAQGIGEWIDKTNDTGYAAETAAIKMDNLSGDVEKLKGALSTLFIESGENGNDFLRGATQRAEGFVNVLSSMPDWASKAAFGLTGITAVTGGGLWFGSKVITGIADTRAALDNLKETSVGASRALGAVGTALKVTALLEGLNILDSAINQVFDQRLDQSNLVRSLDALRQGRVEGEILDQYGEDLVGFADDVDLATSKFTAISRFAMKVPLAGGFIAGDTADAVEDFKKLDEVFSSMVEGGDAEGAAALFDRLSAAAVAGGHSVEDVARQFPQYEQALRNAANEGFAFSEGQRGVARSLDETGAPAGRAVTYIDGVGRAADRAALQAESLDAAMGNLEVTLAGKQRNRAFEQSLDDLAERLKQRKDLQADLKEAQGDLAGADTKEERQAALDHIKALKEQIAGYKLTLDDGVQAGRDWNTALENIAKSAVEAGADLEGMDRVRYLNNARKDFIDLATKITGSREEAVRLADDLELVHQKKVKPKIDVDTTDAENDVRRFNRMLENLKPRTVKIFVETVMSKNDIGELGDPRFARGFATGGWTGNYPINSVAGVVHGQEYVVPAGPAAEYRQLLDTISRKVPGYRDGGFVRQMQAQTTTNYYGTGTVSLTDSDIQRLAVAMSNVRPVYGDVHVADGRDFQRVLLEDQRRASLSGVR